MIWRNSARCASVVLSSPELFTESERQLNLSSGNLAASEEEERRQRQFIRGLYVFSLAADLFDFINSGLDLAFASSLVSFGQDSAVYAGILISGVILGRTTIIRGSYLLFKNGVNWNPFWIKTKEETNRTMKLLHCLFFTEAAVFLFEDYPCLVIYGHWSTINFPPEPLRVMDDVNVGFTVVSLALVSILLLVSLFVGLRHLDFEAWSVREKVINSAKVLVTLTLCGLLLRFVILTLQEAFSFTLLNDKQLPSNKLLGIPICDEQTTETRDEYCDEKSFLIRVAFAWLTALGLCYYLVFRAAPPNDYVVFTSTTKLGALAGVNNNNNNNNASDPDLTSTHVDPSHVDDSDGDDDDQDASSASSVGEDDAPDKRKVDGDDGDDDDDDVDSADVEAGQSTPTTADPPGRTNKRFSSHRAVV